MLFLQRFMCNIRTSQAVTFSYLCWHTVGRKLVIFQFIHVQKWGNISFNNVAVYQILSVN